MIEDAHRPRRVLRKLSGHAHNLSALPHVVLQVAGSALCGRHTEFSKSISGITRTEASTRARTYARTDKSRHSTAKREKTKTSTRTRSKTIDLKLARGAKRRAPHQTLLVIWARRMRSLAKCSSRSNLSSAGGGGSLMIGGNTAADSCGSGRSKAGGISVRGSCLTPSSENASTVSGIIFVSKPNRESLKSFVKFFGKLSDSCRNVAGDGHMRYFVCPSSCFGCSLGAAPLLASEYGVDALESSLRVCRIRHPLTSLGVLARSRAIRSTYRRRIVGYHEP